MADDTEKKASVTAEAGVPAAPDPDIDEGHPGGAYLLPDGRLVNAEGQELDRKGNAKRD